MLQTFYTDTLGSRFIKSLLAQTPVPHFDCADYGERIIKDQYYYNKGTIVKCTESGMYTDTNTIVVNNDAKADDKQLFGVFNSSTNYHDPLTHYHFGRYLRYLKNTQGVNLMPFYNCFCGEYFSDFEITTDKKLKTVYSTSEHRIIAVPIRFNHTYTISLDCSTSVTMRACIHNGVSFETIANLESTLESSYKTFPSAQFKFPILYTLKSPTNSAALKEACRYKNQLYLAIQIPLTCETAVTVTEDVPSSGVWCNSEFVQQYCSRLTLFEVETKTPYAFAPRLIEYLLGNVINKNTIYHKNIINVQKALASIDSDYAAALDSNTYKLGIYDEGIADSILNIVNSNASDVIVYDNNLDINKDIEKLLAVGGHYN